MAGSDVMERLARWVQSGPGKRWFEQVDRETRSRDDVVQERHALVARIAEARRGQREDLPKLRAAVAKADAVLDAARAEYEKADRVRYEAGRTAFNLSDRLHSEIRRAEGRLRGTADPRLGEMQGALGDVRRDWDRIWNRLALRAVVGEFDTSRTVITNKAELEALRLGLNDAHEAIERFKLIPEPTEAEIVTVLARGQAALDAIGTAHRGSEVVR